MRLQVFDLPSAEEFEDIFTKKRKIDVAQSSDEVSVTRSSPVVSSTSTATFVD